MPIYNFYRIVSDIGTKEYIGSTRQPLYKRFYEHKNTYKLGKSTCASKTLFDEYGIDTCSIILISQLECETKEEALREERRIYDERKENIINKSRPFCSVEERKEYNKTYIKEHRKEINEYKRKNYEENKEKNKEIHNEKAKKYYEKNKEKINARRQVKRAEKKLKPV